LTVGREVSVRCGKHFRDSEISIGNPILAVRDACGVKTHKPRLSKKKLDINQADFPGGIQIWGSNPAFIWTSDRNEEEGIHVHAFREPGNEPDLDDTYGEVTIDEVRSKRLERQERHDFPTPDPRYRSCSRTARL